MTMILCLMSQTLSLYLHPTLFSLHLIIVQAHLLSLKIHQFLHLCLVHLALHPLCSLLGLLHELQLANVVLIGSKSPTLLDLDHLNGLRTTESPHHLLSLTLSLTVLEANMLLLRQWLWLLSPSRRSSLLRKSLSMPLLLLQ